MTLQDTLARQHVAFRRGHSDPNKISIHCPFCVERGKSQDTQFRLCLHAKLGWGKCLHCGWSWRHAVLYVLRRVGINEVPKGFEQEAEKRTPPVQLPEDFQVLTQASDDLDNQAQKYLLDRGITLNQIAANRIGVSYVGRFAYRILFPVYAEGKLRAINARDFTGRQKPKYLNTVGDKYLYHFDPKKEVLILSEGAFKALRIQQVTPHASAALLGHDLTTIQLGQIKSSAVKTIILYPDPDPVGKAGIIKLADSLVDSWNGWSGEVRVVWPVTAPADEAPLPTIKDLLQKTLLYSGLTRRKLQQ